MSRVPPRRPCRADPRVAPQPAAGPRPTVVPHPVLLSLLDRLVEARLRVLVPRGGTGADAIAWAAAGHDGVTVDHAEAIQACRVRSRNAQVRLVALEMDVLRPPRDFEAEFDAVWERTCFGALEPHQREAYVRAMARVLRPGGHFYGLFLEHGDESRQVGPVGEACIRSHFHRCFEILSVVALRPPTSPLKGMLATLRRRPWRPCRGGR